ncbi:GNAT family N-acetyltransferase [Aminobacter sp. AP02]|uniref:GNAT family N-acetyltransferase n=1 Tax=Aminobacter sp. AP02 TaxID=2135737 RepID=UPI000D6CF343|nr:GNAT family N-acetyltransferase [Aminobacter sp. AP02]PWK72817.1 putative acetyltransferase [Aminobacter sp. AP02]
MKHAHSAKIRAYFDTTDRNPLADIWLKASRVGHPFLTEADLVDQQAKVREIYLPQAENWVVELDGQPVGFIGLIDSFIGGLFVDPAAHGHGLGKALVAHAAQLKGSLDVEVYAENEAAVAFYDRIGFAEVLRKPHDDEGLLHEVIRMRRTA